jgi:DNA replication protein DnaC
MVRNQAPAATSLSRCSTKLDKYDHRLDDLSVRGPDRTSALFELIAHRYERHSIAITANQPFQHGRTFSLSRHDRRRIDRQSPPTIIEMNGDSYRKRPLSLASRP